MATPYGIIYDSFFDGPTGVAIRELGGVEGQLCSTYLLKNRQDNMIGLYPLDLAVMRTTLGTLSPEQIVRGMVACARATFADYDTLTGYVWVRELARFRLSLTGEPMNEKDRRAIGVNKLYRAAKPNPFLKAFYSKYRRDFPFLERRGYQGACKGLSDLEKPYNINHLPLTSNQEIKSDQEIKIPRAKIARATSLLFEAFWRDYPKKVKKAEALKAWWKVFPDGLEDGALAGRIMTALDWQRKSAQWTKNAGEFIPHPTSWLNGKRWEDEKPHTANLEDPNAAMWERLGVR